MTDPRGRADRCPTTGEIADLLGDRLGPHHRELLEAHVGACLDCQRRLLSAVEETTWPNHAPIPPADAAGISEPGATFLGRLRDAIRGQVGSTPGPGPWNARPAGAGPDSEPDPALPAIRGIEIHHELGRGGMGTVYRARQIGLDRAVALKLIWLGRGHTIDNAVRLGRGPKAIARLTHPHIVQIFQVGMQDGWVFAVFELLEGGDLKGTLRDGPWPPGRAAGLVRTLAEAAHFMHGKGFVHCDLKSSNILLTAEGVPKIADFGLVKRFGDEPTSFDEPASVLGTPSYMAPEQAAGRDAEIGPASDIHALGAILYELLVGRPPFLGSTREETLRQVIEMEPDPPSRLRPEVPRALDAICGRCLAKNPRQRYTDAQELADDLARHLDSHGSTRAWGARLGSWLPRSRDSSASSQPEADRARAKAEAALEEAERVLYRTRLALAERDLDRGDLAAARAVLSECVPAPGRPDRRDHRWAELWKSCRSDG